MLCDVTIEGDRIAAVARAGAGLPPAGAETLDAAGALVLPGLVDAHVHLDKAHTWHRAPNRTATFWDALETLHKDKVNWTPPTSSGAASSRCAARGPAARVSCARTSTPGCRSARRAMR